MPGGAYGPDSPKSRWSRGPCSGDGLGGKNFKVRTRHLEHRVPGVEISRMGSRDGTGASTKVADL